MPEGKRYIGRCARAVGVRVEFNFGRAVIVVVCGTKRSTRLLRVQVHRCAIRDDSALLRACHGSLQRGSGRQQSEAQRGLHSLLKMARERYF